MSEDPHAIEEVSVGLITGERAKRTLGSMGQFFHTALIPSIFALIGASLAIVVHYEWTVIDSLYWTVITMTTIGLPLRRTSYS